MNYLKGQSDLITLIKKDMMPMESMLDVKAYIINLFPKDNRVSSRIKDIVYQVTMEANLENDMDFRDDLGLDSLEFVELIMQCESDFNLKITDGDAEDLTTVGKLVKYIEDRT